MTAPSELTEKAFSDRRRAEWDALYGLTIEAQTKNLRKLPTESLVRFSPLYRSVCADLAAAQAARYSAPLVDYLLGLTAAAHAVIYGPHATRHEDSRRYRFRHAWLIAFPRAVRRQKGAMLLALAMFFVPLAFGAALTLHEPTFAFRIVPEAMLRPLAETYARGFENGRESGEGALMAGFYVYNNVGIALRCFALGILFGLGSAFYLVQNGLSIGAILGYVASQGAGYNVGLFIIGHGSLELGAIVLAGGAGLSIGWSIVAPGDLPRLSSLQRRAREILVIASGASVMLVMAAAIEAFWSASSVPSALKLGVGATLFTLVLAYILLGGRSDDDERTEAHALEGRSGRAGSDR